MTLEEDFGIWWNMPKYNNVSIPARGFSKEQIKSKHGSSHGWPGTENVQYWVELANGWVVGIVTPKKGNAEFPMYLMR